MTRQFPREELFGLVSQMRRAAVSIPSNIAEGSKKGTAKDFRNFLRHAKGSAAELETQLEIAKRLRFGKERELANLSVKLDRIMAMLHSLIASLPENKSDYGAD